MKSKNLAEINAQRRKIWNEKIKYPTRLRKEISSFLKAKRSEAGLTQDKVVAKVKGVKISKASLCHYELGVFEIPFEKLDKLLVAYGVTWEEFGKFLDERLNS